MSDQSQKRQMKVLVTGGAGFIGSHLVRSLSETHEVFVLDDCSVGSISNLRGVECHFLHESVSNPLLSHELPTVDVIFHLAGESRIQPSFADTKGTYLKNCFGTWNLLKHYANQSGPNVPRFVFASSSVLTGSMELNPYAYTKGIAEKHLFFWDKTGKIDCAAARIYNVYGPGQYEEGSHATVIGIFERQMREGVPLTIVGDGRQRRDFIHVDDVVRGLITIGFEAFNNHMAYDLGTGTSHSISEVARLFGGPTEFLDKRKGELEETQAKPHQQMLDWKAEVKLEDYIKELQEKKWERSRS